MKILLHSISFLLGAFCIYWVFRTTDFSALISSFERLSWGVLLVICPIILSNLFLRAIRWRAMFERASSLPVRPFFSAISIGYLANNILPARGGDLLRVYYLSVQQNIRKSQAFSTVLVERASDLFIACMLLGGASLLLDVPRWLQNGALIIGFFAACGLLALFVLTYFKFPIVVRLETYCLTLFPKVSSWVLFQVAGFAQGVRPMMKISSVLRFVLFTMLLWVAEFGVAYLMAESFNLSLSPAQVLLVMMFSVFASLIPALPGQLGAFELAVVTGLELLGRTGENVLGFAIGWHMIILLTTSTVGAFMVLLNKNIFVRRTDYN